MSRRAVFAAGPDGLEMLKQYNLIREDNGTQVFASLGQQFEWRVTGLSQPRLELAWRSLGHFFLFRFLRRQSFFDDILLIRFTRQCSLLLQCMFLVQFIGGTGCDLELCKAVHIIVRKFFMA